jgi:hypothetical protein
MTSGWPERSGGIRRAVMATSENVAITAYASAAGEAYRLETLVMPHGVFTASLLA